MRPWQFSKPKNPGFGIAADYYLSVLCSTAVMPSIHAVINPEGEGGAMVGFGAPLSAPSSDKSVLRQPLGRGAYVVAAKDRKTVLKMLVLNGDETSFDPEAFARSSIAQEAAPELVARVRATWNLAQLTFESHHPMVYPALDFFMGVARRIAQVSDGVVADPVSQRYLLPEEVFRLDRLDPRVDAREQLATKRRRRPDGLQVYTLGMQKFGLPEYEILNLFDEDEPYAHAFLLSLSQQVLLGDLTRPGDQFGLPKFQFEAREGGFERDLWEGISVFELLPPTTLTAGECLRAWAASLPKNAPSA
jgi:hypothetical protein